MSWRLSEPVTASVVVTNEAGDTVRTLLSDQPDDATVSVTWDGLTDAGVLAADGIYDVTFMGVDVQGDSASDVVRVGVTQSVPGVWSAPADGSTVSGLVDLVFAPTEGYDISYVRFRFHSSSFNVSSGAADGSWRTQIDTSNWNDGDYSAYVDRVSWVDELGGGHSQYRTPVATITIDNASANPVVVESSPADRVFSPNGDTFEDVYQMSWRLSEPVTASVVVTNEAGDTVRTLLSDQPDDATVSVTWDGLTDAGVLAADGIYDVTFMGVDVQGDSASDVVRVGVTQSVPGVWSAPADGSTVSGLVDLVFAPTEGYDISYVRFRFHSSSFNVSSGAADGSWRTQIDTSNWNDGDYSAYVDRVSWVDELGGGHSQYRTPVATITIDNASANPVVVESSPADRVFSPNGDTFEDVYQMSWRLSEPVTASVVVTNEAGDTVRSLVSDAASDTSDRIITTWDGFDDFGVVVPDGIYSATLSATDESGDSASDVVRVGVTQSVPGVWSAPADGSTVSGLVDLVSGIRSDRGLRHLVCSVPVPLFVVQCVFGGG